MIKDATYTSVWDSGYEVTTACKVNMETNEVFDIEMSDVDADLLEVLDDEFVTIDGQEFSVSGERDCTEYWYK